MTTYEELTNKIDAATARTDADQLEDLAEAIEKVDTPDATIRATIARGTVARIRAQYPLALQLFDKALTLSGDDKDQNASVHANIGVVYAMRGEFATALDHMHQALDLYKKLDNINRIASASGNIGQLYRDHGDLPAALEYLERALSLHLECDNFKQIARTTGNIATVYEGFGDYPKALEYQNKALLEYRKNNDEHGVALTTGNIGVVYNSIGDYDQSLSYYKAALKLHTSLNDKRGIARVVGNIGSVYQVTARHHEAMASFEEAYQMHMDLGDKAGTARMHASMIEVLIDQGEFVEAETLHNQQESLNLNSPVWRLAHLSHAASIKEHKGDLDGANEALLSALAIASRSSLKTYEASVHKNLRDLSKKRGDFESYITHNDEYTRITEEIRGRETTQKMAMLEAQKSIAAERVEREKERAILFGALPESIANRMIAGEKISGDHYDHASVIFLDIVGFTALSDTLPPAEVVEFLERIFTAFDQIVERYAVTKIKTIGDSYMAVAGVPEAQPEHATNALRCAVAMMASINGFREQFPELAITARIGIHCGPLTAGVIGTSRLQYDVWGDTVNVASRMESTGEAGKIQVSEAFYQALRNADGSWRHPEASVKKRGSIEVKGKGEMVTYWLSPLTLDN